MRMDLGLKRAHSHQKEEYYLKHRIPQDRHTDTCTGTERHTHEHAYIDDLCPATVETSSSREGSAGISGSGEGPSGSREESIGSSNREEGSFITLHVGKGLKGP